MPIVEIITSQRPLRRKRPLYAIESAFLRATESSTFPLKNYPLSWQNAFVNPKSPFPHQSESYMSPRQSHCQYARERTDAREILSSTVNVPRAEKEVELANGERYSSNCKARYKSETASNIFGIHIERRIPVETAARIGALNIYLGDPHTVCF